MPPRGASGPAAAAAGSPEKQSRTAWWCRTAEQVSRELKVDAAVGLSDDEARARLERFGPNELAKEPGTPLWKLILEQFDDTLVKVRFSRQRESEKRALAAAAAVGVVGRGARRASSVPARSLPPLELPARRPPAPSR